MRILLLLVLFTTSLQLFANSYNTVGLNHSVYDLIEVDEGLGLFETDLGDVKPYTENYVLELLLELDRKRENLSDLECSILDDYLMDFENDSLSLLPPGLFLGFKIENKLDLSSSSDLHSVNLGVVGIKGTFYEVLSYNINLGIFYNSVNRDVVEPYTFTKEYDGFHMNLLGGDSYDYETGLNPVGISVNSLPELTLSLFDDNLLVGLNRVRRNWGEGESSLILSGTGRPIFGLDYRWKMNDHISLSGLYGSLSSSNGGNGGSKTENQKNLTVHYLEIFVNKYLDLAIFDNAIWGKRDEIGYMFIMPTFLTQQVVGDVDNVALGGTITGKYPGVGKVYFSLYIDEVEIDNFSEFFHHNKNMYAWNTGIKTVIPKVPFGLFSFQYTKIEPYCYAHYMQEYPNYGDNLINTNYTNDGENIGYYLPPNSDEFLFKVSAKPFAGLDLGLKYSYIRHGDNSWEGLSVEDGDTIPVGGSVDKPLIYTDNADQELYVAKDFLNDGIYELIHTISLEIGYDFVVGKVPFGINLGYSYVDATNYENIEGNDVVKNILTFGFETSL